MQILMRIVLRYINVRPKHAARLISCIIGVSTRQKVSKKFAVTKSSSRVRTDQMESKHTVTAQTDSEVTSSQADQLLMERIAKAHGFDLYQHYSEGEVAKLIKLHPSTLKRARATGAIGFIRKGTKSIAYFGFQLAEYLLSNTICAKPKNGSTN
jgi:hypothetical protein